MTDDFHLFGDPDDADRPTDPDVALVSAYLARELSPMQVLAVEERLATDAAFRAAMQPLLDAWAAPLPSIGGHASHRTSILSERERDASWRRFQQEMSPAVAVRQVSQRRMTMKRAAAVIALVVVPMASFAQVVMYAASNPDARGHAIAKSIVAPFARAASPTPRAQLRGGAEPAPNAPRAREVDTGALLPVPTAPVFELESERAAKTRSTVVGAFPTPVSPTAMVATTAQRREPNRARIAELARQHQPAVISGDSAATYIVMVLDASDSYLWSTPGSGNVTIEVFGDTRTPDERLEYNRQHYAEFWGAPAAAAGRGVWISLDSTVRTGTLAPRTATGVGAGSGGGGRGGRVAGVRDSAGAYRDITGAVQDRMMVRRDSMVRLTADSLEVRGRAGGWFSAGAGTVVRGDSTQVMVRDGRALVGGAGRAGGGGVATRRSDRGDGLGGDGAEGTSPMLAFNKATGTYRSGWFGTPDGAASNQAAGLTRPGDGESGIAGVASTSVSSAETYYFRAGDLAPRSLKVMVVHLVPGAVWVPR